MFYTEEEMSHQLWIGVGLGIGVTLLILGICLFLGVWLNV